MNTLSIHTPSMLPSETYRLRKPRAHRFGPEPRSPPQEAPVRNSPMCLNLNCRNRDLAELDGTRCEYPRQAPSDTNNVAAKNARPSDSAHRNAERKNRRCFPGRGCSLTDRRHFTDHLQMSEQSAPPESGKSIRAQTEPQRAALSPTSTTLSSSDTNPTCQPKGKQKSRTDFWR